MTMYDLRKDCPMRHENGNCTVAGGFCTSVNDPICEALHNAYNCGYRHSAIREQEGRRWIPVMELTPENIGLYLVIEKHWLDGSLGIKIAKWNTTDWFTADRKSKEITPRVTHWMPLPELPKKRVVQNEM